MCVTQCHNKCGYFNAELIDCIKEKKKFRIIGDNVNFSVDVSHLRSSQKKHMEHWFGSAALIQNLSFGHLSQDVPQQNLLQVGWETFLPNEKDWTRVRNDYAILIMRVLVQHVEVFKPLSKVLPQNLSEPYSEVNMKKTTKVIPLPVVAKNEQRYSDVIDVLDSYEQLLVDVHQKAGKQMADDFTVHIGGDQLTRERFSGAKRLRGMGALLQNRFQHLSPITFEFFHLQMSLLSIIYKCLYNDKSTETGTLGAERTRLGRSRADGKNVKNHYEDCKELAISVIDMYILEAACHFFGLTKLDDIPTHSVVDFEEMSQKDQLSWIYTTVGKMVDTLVWPYGFEAVQSIVEPKPSYSKVTIVMPNGQVTELLIPSNVIKTAPSIDDGMKTYAHNILELGLLYKDLTDSTKCPDRERMIPILKLTMLVCKGKSTKSKYALEILRFLCHQFATLSEQVAHESFFGCFVNTGGKVDTHIPADMAMEHMVRRIKDHIRTLQSNKAESTIRKRTAAFAGLESICDKFDHETSVIVRAQKHKTPSSSSDERILFQNLHRLKPFEHQADRKVMSHPRLSSSILNNLTRHQLQSWINGHKVNLTGEIGK